MRQLELDFRRSRANDPDTSKNAGATDRPTQRDRCYRALRDVWPEGLNDDELAGKVGCPSTSAGKRRLELYEQGLVEAVFVWGRRLTRPTRHGRSAQVWRAVRGEVDVGVGDRL